MTCKAPNRAKARRCKQRRAFSLLELAAVVLLIGLVGAAAIGRFGTKTLQNISAEGYAQMLALDLAQARQRTIATGDNHYLSMTVSLGDVASYTVFRRAAGGDVAVEPATPTPDGLSVATSHSTLEFDFDGAALAAYSITIDGPQRSWSVAATPLTGAIVATDTTP